MKGCTRCDGSGLIPFINEQGKIIPNAYLFCDCHPTYGLHPEPEHTRPLRPEDIDYPVSYSHYRSLCQRHGWTDPGPDRFIEKESEPQVIEHIHRTSDMSQKEFAKLQSLIGEVKYLRDKVSNLEKPIRKKRRYNIYK